jgi:ABC-type transport system substrate-binding protein
MSQVFDRQTMATFLIAVFIFMTFSPALPVNALDVQGDLNVGPYVDKVVFKIIQNKDQMLLLLVSGEIDIVQEFIHPVWYQALDEEPSINIYRALRNGYGLITINCAKYPLNISGFRKAFAHAFDKTRVRIEVLDGYSQDHDSLVPYVNDYSIEDYLPYHYYSAEPEIGNKILDDLGFGIDPITGFRNAPNGSTFNVIIQYDSLSEEIAGPTARIGVDALRSLHIDADARAGAANTILSTIYFHQDYDMIFYGLNFLTKDVVWLTDLWSIYTDYPFRNPCNFANTTYDSWCQRLTSSLNYTEAYEAAANMQMILHENVPGLVVYENIYNQAYRNDVFTGHVPDKGRYIVGQWTLRNIHRTDGTMGGIVTVARVLDLISFNIFRWPGDTIQQLLWPTLFSIGPDLNFVPNLAESIQMETHADNPSVFEGNTRFIVEIVQNATWSDGTQITANDVAFTFTYLYESAKYGNPRSAVLGDLVAAYAPSTYRAIIEFNSESMWHLSSFVNEFIMPKHIFNDVDGIGYDGWSTWNPVFNPEHPFVTAGPFLLTDLEQGEFYELTVNPDFWYLPSNFCPDTYSDPTTDTQFDTTLAIAAGVVGAAVTILIGRFVLFRSED